MGASQSRDQKHHGGHSHQHFGSPNTPLTRQGVQATWISLAGLVATAAVQAVIVVISGSVALLADTIHNLADALTAVPLLIAFRLGRRPPSRRYPYGFHRAEDLAGIAIVLVILVSALFAGAEAIRHLRDPEPIDHVGLVFVAGLVGFVGNEAVAMYRIRAGRSIGSAALEADGLHARADGLTSLGVVISAGAVWLGLERADALVGLAITFAIVWTLIQAGQSVLHRALDGAEESTIALIETVAASIPGVEHVLDTRARWTGHQLRAETCIAVDAALTVQEGHAIAEDVRLALLGEIPSLVDAIVHVDPHELPDRGP